MDKKSKVYVAGHRGLAGSALVRELEKQGYANLVFRTHKQLDLTDAKAVDTFFAKEKPDYVFLAAAKVGGILANDTKGADFIADNLAIELNVIRSAWKYKAKKLLFLGSSCIYPKMAPQPIKEEYLLTGLLESTNEPYAVAKIAGIKMCQAFNKQYGTNYISAMPTNLYGPNDNFDLETAHVLPALIHKMHEAKMNNSPTVEIWGTGKPRRELLHVDDLARACIFLMSNYDGDEIVNIGTGSDVTIKELAEMVKEIVGFTGKLTYNTEKPDGTPQKLLDVSRINALGWKAGIGLPEGVELTYRWFVQNIAKTLTKPQ